MWVLCKGEELSLVSDLILSFLIILYFWGNGYYLGEVMVNIIKNLSL